jgi:hypothetical protein
MVIVPAQIQLVIIHIHIQVGKWEKEFDIKMGVVLSLNVATEVVIMEHILFLLLEIIATQ